MRKSFVILGLSSAILALNACKTVMDPTFIPSGYSYHHDLYKSPPADKPWDIGYDYTRDANAEILQKWQMVAADLVDRLQADSAIGATPVFLSSPEIDNAFSLSLDHALREEFRSRNMMLASIPSDESFKIAVSVYDPEFKDRMRSFTLNDEPQIDRPEPPKAVNKTLVIKIIGLVDGMSAPLVEEPYELPLYGYQDAQLYFPLSQKIAEVWR